MARRNISLPDQLDEEARRAGLNVSALAQRAVADELDRQGRMAQLDAWLDELDAAHGAPSAEAMASARQWFDSTSAARSKKAPRRKSRPAPPRGAQRAAG
jgi:post-segregation antitoxin (ccd killing protein)